MAAPSVSVVDKFGVELEMVLAFHEDLLTPVLQRRGLTKQHIVKRLSKQDRSNIGIKTIPGYENPQSRPSHRGWALRKDPNDLDDWKHRVSQRDQDYRAGYTAKYRTYWAEPLEIVRDILQEHGLNAKVELSSHPNDPTYDDWKVANDCTLVPLSNEQKLLCFQDRIAVNDVNNWDTTGIEIVTPPMRSNNPIVFQEIGRYLTVLRGNKNSAHGIVTSKYAGVHVHIGFAKPEAQGTLLQVMQHLAYMLVQFEPVLVKLFPPHRDGGRPGNIICANDTRSNLAGIINWEKETYGKNNPSLRDLAISIFNTQSIAALRLRMHHDKQHKGYQVNFRNIELASFQPWNTKRTVEFRLHESTVNAHDIEMWVRFCLAFCRAAERQVARPMDWNGSKITQPYSAVTEYSKYKMRKLDDKMNNTDLFGLLELDEDLRVYWQARWDRYHNEQDMERPTPELVGPFSSSSSADSDGNDPGNDNPDTGDPKGKGKGTGPSSRGPSTPKGKGKPQDRGSPYEKGKSGRSAEKGKKTAAQSPKPNKADPKTQSLGAQTQTLGQKRKRIQALTTVPGNSKRVLRSGAQLGKQ